MFSLALLRTTLWVFNHLPLPIRLWAVEGIVRAYAVLFPKVKRVSLKNLTLVFPQATDKELGVKLDKSFRSLARFIVDSARYHTLDEEWVRSHIEMPFAADYQEMKKRHPAKGILFASGHLGSIELQALAAPFMGRQISFVARNLKHGPIDTWWKKNRERFGNQVIDRKGAVPVMLANLKKGLDVAILIDQNVRKEHALFIDWFGRPAATTFAFGKAAVETEAHVIISAISYIGNERYRLNEYEFDLSEVYADKSLSTQEKIIEATKRVSLEYQRMILSQPSEWFWLHRRWKTTPEGVAEDFYNS